MIERQFITQKTKEYYIKEYVESILHGAGISEIRLKKIPLGEKIIVHASRPSLIVGSKGSNIKQLTKVLKDKFKLENPQIEIVEVKNVFLDANVVAEKIASSLERFGSARFKSIGYKVLTNVMGAGAIGVELILSGKIPSARARSWRFYQGYLKKCGDIAVSGVLKAKKTAQLKSGSIGIKVLIMPPDLVLPDHVEILKEPIKVMEEITTEKSKDQVEEKKESGKETGKNNKKKTVKKKTVKKTTSSSVESSIEIAAEKSVGEIEEKESLGKLSESIQEKSEPTKEHGDTQ